MSPTTWDGNRWSTGKPNPVTLVASVVPRKSSVHPRRSRPLSRPAITTNPEPIPTRLSPTCRAVKVASGSPQAMAMSSVQTLRQLGRSVQQRRANAGNLTDRIEQAIVVDQAVVTSRGHVDPGLVQAARVGLALV